MDQVSVSDVKASWDLRLLIQKVNTDTSLDDIESGSLDSAVAFANSTIEDYLRGRYPIPLPISCVGLQKIGIALANYEIHSKKNKTVIPEHVQGEYDNAIARLKDYQKGNAILPITIEVEDRPSDVVVISKKRKYTEHFLRRVM